MACWSRKFMRMDRCGSLAKESSMDLPAIEAMTYFTAIFWLGGFAVGLIIKLILPQNH